MSEHALVMAHFSHAYRKGAQSILASWLVLKMTRIKRKSMTRFGLLAMDECAGHKSAISHHHGVGFSKQGG